MFVTNGKFIKNFFSLRQWVLTPPNLPLATPLFTAATLHITDRIKENLMKVVKMKIWHRAYPKIMCAKLISTQPCIEFLIGL